MNFIESKNIIGRMNRIEMMILIESTNIMDFFPLYVRFDNYNINRNFSQKSATQKM